MSTVSPGSNVDPDTAISLSTSSHSDDLASKVVEKDGIETHENISPENTVNGELTVATSTIGSPGSNPLELSVQDQEAELNNADIVMDEAKPDVTPENIAHSSQSQSAEASSNHEMPADNSDKLNSSQLNTDTISHDTAANLDSLPDSKIESKIDKLHKFEDSSSQVHSDVDIDFDPSFFSLENLEISKDKDGKTTIDGISFSILDNNDDNEHDFKQELIEDPLHEKEVHHVISVSEDIKLEDLSDSQPLFNGANLDDMSKSQNGKFTENQEESLQGDLFQDDGFGQNLVQDQVKLFQDEETHSLEKDDIFDTNLGQELADLNENQSDKLVDQSKDDETIFSGKFSQTQEELFREVSQSLSNDDLPDLGVGEDKLVKGGSLGELLDFNLNAAIDSLNSEHLLSTPRQPTRAQSEALETHIQKPKLQKTHPASVPHSPTNSTVLPNTSHFLPRSFNSPLSNISSGSPTSRKPNQLSKLVKNRSDKSSTLQAINGATSEHPEAHYIQSDGAPRVSAYARLDFSSFTFYVQTLQVILGRSAENGTGMVDVDLGPVKAISRRHAKIFYNFGTQRFELSVLGRNGAFVDDTFIDTGSTVPLKDGTKIQIGQISFSFVLPSSSPIQRSQEPEDDQEQFSLPIKQEDDAYLQDSYIPDILSPGGATQPSDTRSPSLAMTEIDSQNFLSDRLDLSISDLGDSRVKQEAGKAESKPPVKHSSKRQSTRKEYLPEEIPEEYREKPQFSYSHLIATALRAHPEASGISLSEIYKSIQDIFPFYKYCPHGWQNSVRHNLSSNKAFRKISKEGKGWLWGIDEEYFQERERLKKKAAANSMKAKAASAAAAKAKHVMQQEKELQQLQQMQDQQFEKQSQNIQNQQSQFQQNQLTHTQQNQQISQTSKDHAMSLPDSSSFVPEFQKYNDNQRKQSPPLSTSLHDSTQPRFESLPISHSAVPTALLDASLPYSSNFNYDKDTLHNKANQPSQGLHEDETKNDPFTSSRDTSPSSAKTFMSSATPIKKERAKTIAELASEIQIDSTNDRLYRPNYSAMTRESYIERKNAKNSDSASTSTPTSTPENLPSYPTTTSTSHIPPAIATNSIAQNDAILNSPRYQQYYSTSATTPPIPSTRVTTSVPVYNNQTTPSIPASRSTVPVQSMAAGQNTFRMTQAPKTSGPPAQPTQSQLQKQTSVPQMRVNPQIPQGVREVKNQPFSGTKESGTASQTSLSGPWQQQSQGQFSSTPLASSSRSSSPVASDLSSNKTNSAGSDTKSSGTAAAKPGISANLANLNLPKDTLRILNLLQEKIKAQMQSSGQPINSKILTNALAIAISQLTKNSAGGGPAALSNLLKGKNQAQLVSALATAIISAKKPNGAGPSKGSSSSSASGAPRQASATQHSPARASTHSDQSSKRSVSPAAAFTPPPLPKALNGIPGLMKIHPPVNVPSAISSPASLTAGLPVTLSNVATSTHVPQQQRLPTLPPRQSTSPSPVLASSPSPPKQSISFGTPTVSTSPTLPATSTSNEAVNLKLDANAGSLPPPVPGNPSSDSTSSASPLKESSTLETSPMKSTSTSQEVGPTPPAPQDVTTPSAPAQAQSTPLVSATAPTGAGSAAKSKAEMIAEMLAKASKLTNPSPSIKAALAQLQAHATKLGLKIPDNLKKLDTTSSGVQAITSAPSSSNTVTNNNLKRNTESTHESISANSDEHKSKIQKTGD